MGTNYYVSVEPPCEHCGRGGENLHVGKQSFGWAFLFAAYPERMLTSAKSWREFLQATTAPLVDEYGETIDKDRFWKMVDANKKAWTSRSAPLSAWGSADRERYEYIDEDGYRVSRSADFS